MATVVPYQFSGVTTATGAQLDNDFTVACTAIDVAQAAANTAQATATSAQSTADTAEADATTALSAAATALSTATAAQSTANAAVPQTRTVNGQALSSNVTVTTITGNAGSATVLATPRTIDGISFDGSANILVIAPATHAATAGTVIADADEIPVADSESSFSLKKYTWAVIKATLLATVNAWTKSQSVTPVALSVSSNAIAVDLSLSNNFTVTLQATTGQTLSNPTNAVAGASGQIAITQNATPSTLAFGANWISTDGSTPVVSTTANTVNLLSYYVVDSTHIWFSLNTHGVV